jgi:arylsulfatase A-like enzyme
MALAGAPVVTRAEGATNIVVIVTDEHGYADLGVQGIVRDVRTPHLDRLAREGVLCTNGYVTAPQCSPSRAALLTGRYQQRIGMNSIADMPLPLETISLAERLKPAGYTSATIGKWHLEPTPASERWLRQNNVGLLAPDHLVPYFPAAHGFDFHYTSELNGYFVNYEMTGIARDPGWVTHEGFRVDLQTEAALAFIKEHRGGPFLAYVNYMAPHTPLEIPLKYLQPEWESLPTRRQAALAMISAVDDGVGRLVKLLEELKIQEDTLIFFISDNGAPLHGQKDSPLDTDHGGWDGSLNAPLLGEKGMLAEGGIRVPFIVNWKGKLPAGKKYDGLVSSLDIVATSNSAAGLAPDPDLEGVDLLPLLTEEREASSRILFWRFWTQTAAREGNWKYLRVADREFLFDLSDDNGETTNLAVRQPDKLAKLREKTRVWADELQPSGFPTNKPNSQEIVWFRQYYGEILD